MMKASIEMSQWQFSTDRMIEDYYVKLYRPQALPRAVTADPTGKQKKRAAS
jgi:hypothetical protein